jgi:hypothetical protein
MDNTSNGGVVTVQRATKPPASTIKPPTIIALLAKKTGMRMVWLRTLHQRQWYQEYALESHELRSPC